MQIMAHNMEMWVQFQIQLFENLFSIVLIKSPYRITVEMLNWRCNVYYCIRWSLILFLMSRSHLLKYIPCSFYIACIPESEDAAVNNHSSCWSPGFDIREQMYPPTLNGVSNVHQLCMSQSKMELRVWQ